MKNIITFGFVLFFFSCASPEKSESPTNKEINEKLNFVKTFEGKIDNKYEIIAKIESNNNVITGSYNYKSSTGEMELSGNFTNGQDFEINEFNSKGSMTGKFKGTFSNGKMDGTWNNAKGDKSLPFYLIESNTPYVSMSEKSNISGCYKGYSNTLTITSVTANSFKAEFCISTLECEMGCYSGLFILKSNNVYEGSIDLNPEKKVIINIKDLNLDVSSEFERGDDLGAHCSLDESYKKLINCN